MKCRFIGQPFESSPQAGTILADLIATSDDVKVAVAWARREGLLRLEEPLAELRERGGRSSAIVGIDHGLATAAGLRETMRLFDRAHVLHDPGERTYHPKLYVLRTASTASVVIGSSNATSGGLFTNYECDVLVELDLAIEDDRAFLAACEGYFRELLECDGACLALTPELIERIASVAGALRSDDADERERERSRASGLSAIFRRPARPLRSTPASTSRRTRPSGDRAGRRVEREWSKTLTKSDAMRKDDASHQRRQVVLNQAGHDIDQRTFFVDELFAGVSWREEPTRAARGATARVKRVADVPFDVVIDGVDNGRHVLRVEHADFRDFDQGNSPTSLNWGELKDVLQLGDYTGALLTLRRHEGGTFSLSLDRRR